ncbi:MAG TPA: hypothetical protein VI547_12050, partial [Anaerolineales bacterium]|nr:hypothetical protein [Anaerolineales bacterium]
MTAKVTDYGLRITKYTIRDTRVLLIPTLLLATFFRFHALDLVPPGVTHDEAAIGFFVRQVANNTGFTIDAPYGYANEPFTQYSASVVMWLVGQSDWALRAHQAFWGVMLVLFTYKWGRAAFNRNVGLGGAALAAVGFWPTMTSRFALNSNPAPALFTAAVWLMWEALFGRPVRSSLTSLRYGALRETSQVFVWLGFSLCLAASLYTYEASRGAWLALPAFLLFLLFPVSFISPLVRRRLWSLAVALSFG